MHDFNSIYPLKLFELCIQAIVAGVVYLFLNDNVPDDSLNRTLSRNSYLPGY